ncbi:MAG: DsrE/DsrF/DrsH-like family protein [Candidatus Nitrosocaldus sp.]
MQGGARREEGDDKAQRGEEGKEEGQEVHIVLVSKEASRAYPAFVLALGSVAMGAKCKVYCTMDALEIVKKGGASKITLAGAPSLEKYLKDAIAAGVKVTACGPSKEMLIQMGIRKDTLEEGVEFEDVIGFLNEALPAAKKGGMIVFL